MNTPVFCVNADESLWTVQQIMEQRLIQRLAVTGTQGELLGIVTHSSILQVLKPSELYKLTEVSRWAEKFLTTSWRMQQRGIKQSEGFQGIYILLHSYLYLCLPTY
jgi:predicted transcriptional regulator